MMLQPPFEQANSAGSGNSQHLVLDKRSSATTNSFRQNLKGVSDRNLLFEIKETDTAAKEVEQSNIETQKKKEITVVPAAQKWVPPPRLKNLRSKKNKKGKATVEQS